MGLFGIFRNARIDIPSITAVERYSISPKILVGVRPAHHGAGRLCANI